MGTSTIPRIYIVKAIMPDTNYFNIGGEGHLEIEVPERIYWSDSIYTGKRNMTTTKKKQWIPGTTKDSINIARKDTIKGIINEDRPGEIGYIVPYSVLRQLVFRGPPKVLGWQEGTTGMRIYIGDLTTREQEGIRKNIEYADSIFFGKQTTPWIILTNHEDKIDTKNLIPNNEAGNYAKQGTNIITTEGNITDNIGVNGTIIGGTVSVDPYYKAAVNKELYGRLPELSDVFGSVSWMNDRGLTKPTIVDRAIFAMLYKINTARKDKKMDFDGGLLY
jgi:hypothetical protein